LSLIFRQFGPLIFVILLSMITSFSGEIDTRQTNQIRDYKFSFTQSYTFPHKLVSGNLNQIYYVNQYTLHDFQSKIERKYRTDDNVEQEVIRRLDKRCSESKKQR